MQRLLLRPSEVQAVLSLSRGKVYALISSGELPSVRIGRNVRVRADALAEWLEERTIGDAEGGYGAPTEP